MRRKRASKASIFISRGRLALMVTVLACAFCAVFGRLYYLHVVKSDQSIAVTDRVRNRIDIIESRRGSITDSRHNLLATSRPVIELGVDPELTEVDDPEVRGKIQTLAMILGEDFSEVLAKCSPSPDKKRWRKLAENMDEAVYNRIMDLKIKGVYGTRSYTRVYPSGALMSHVVGFVNKEFAPVMGVERQFEYYLRGQDGWIETERDGRRRELAQFRTREVSPTDGLNVELSIDLIIQEMAHREIAGIVEKYNPKSATIIVSDPSTGYILAMASYPNFDPNEYNKYDQDALRNRAICDQYEPGSTFKIVAISAALNESLVGPEDMFDCNANTISYKGRILRLPKEAHAMSNLTVREITKKSSNKGVAHLGVLLGEKKLYEYASLYGFGRKTDLGLVGEIGGTLHNVKDWDGLTITRLPMGHAVAVTPLQIHCAMSTVANQGVYMQPQVVRRIYDNNGETVINYAPKAVRRVISPKIATLMSEMLSEVVSETGTARRAMLDGFKVAGKTGTSQKIINGRYSTKDHVASFTGFFPAMRPRLAITVVVDSPKMKGVGYGGLVAAPSFKTIAEQAASYMGIQTDEEFDKQMAWKGTK